MTLVEARAGDERAQLRAVARGGVVNVAGVVVNGLLSFVLVFVLARGLGPAGYGSFSAAVAVFLIVSNVGELGADTGLLHRLPRLLVHRRRRELHRVLAVSLLPVAVTGALLAVVVAAFAPFLSHVLVLHGDRLGTASYLRSLSPFLVIAPLLTVILCGLRGLGSVTAYAAVQNVAIPSLRPLLAAIALALGARGAGIGLAYAVPLAVGFVVAVTMLLAAVRPVTAPAASDPPPRPVDRVAAEFWRFALARGVAGAVAVVVTWVSLLLVSALRSAHDAGVFGVVMRYVVMGTFAFQAARVAIGPQISRLLAQGRRSDTELVFQTATSWLVALAWPYYLLLAVFSSAALSVFGSSFRSGATALAVLCLAELFDMATGNITLVLLMGGRSALNLANIALGLVVTVTLDVTLIPHIGVLGAAIGWAATILVENAAAVLEVAVVLKVRPFGAGVLSVAVAAVVSYGGFGLAAVLVVGQSLAGLAAAALLGTALYLTLLWRRRERLRFDVFREAVGRRNPQGVPS